MLQLLASRRIVVRVAIGTLNLQRKRKSVGTFV